MIWRLIGFVAVAWILGFAVFMLGLNKPVNGQPTDAIVVVTGGAGRIDRGLELLRQKKAKRMLVSGVDRDVRPIELAVEYKVPATLFACCIDLGREAVDTRSNADETAAWVKTHGYRSVRLVTSDWHMARAALELRSVLDDDVTIVRDPVTASPRLMLLLAEYNKYLVRRAALWTGIGR